MTMRNVFGSIASGAQEPGSALDANYNDMGTLMGTTQCTATGTNAITLTPAANQPNVSTPLPANQQLFSFVPAANSTGAVTAQVGSGSFVPVFETNGLQSGANALLTTSGYTLMFLTALNSGAGGFVKVGGSSSVAPFLRSYLAGCTLSTAGGSGTMSISAGVAASDDNTTMMTLAAIAKTTSAWAVGTGNGGLDTGVIANATWYHFFVIERTDTGVVDLLFSLSASAPTLPASYTKQRRIGSGLTDGSAHWTAFQQNGDNFRWTTPTLDGNNISLTTVYANLLLSTPLGIVVEAFGNMVTGTANAHIRPPFSSDGTPAANASPLFTTAGSSGSKWFCRTNTSSQVQWASQSNQTGYFLTTEGWNDTRGKNA